MAQKVNDSSAKASASSKSLLCTAGVSCPLTQVYEVLTGDRNKDTHRGFSLFLHSASGNPVTLNFTQNDHFSTGP